MFSAMITGLERASGEQSVDVRLSAEIVGAVHHKMKALGLDPTDTNGPELYHALLDMVRLHDDFLVRHIGGLDPGDVSDLMPRIVSVAEKIRMPRQVWAIKHSVGKRLLKQQPPKRLMKLLGYRSLESLLKREPMGKVFAAIRFAENENWQKSFIRQYVSLQPGDFESRTVEIYHVDGARWQKASTEFIRSRHHNITHSKEMGSIVVLPLPVERLPGITITALPLIIHYINELRVYSAFFKFEQVKPNFGEIIWRTIVDDPVRQAQIAGQPIHWRTIHTHFGNKTRLNHPELFEPHVQVEDLEWRQAEELLMQLEPALQFWKGLDFVGMMFGNQIVSMNLMDVATNYINQLSYSQQVNTHLRSSLSNELYERYLGHPALESQVLHQLDTDMLGADVLTLRRAVS